MLLPFVVLWAWRGAVAAQPSGDDRFTLHVSGVAAPLTFDADEETLLTGATAFVKAHAPCGDEVDAAACAAEIVRAMARERASRLAEQSPGRDIFGGWLAAADAPSARCPGKASVSDVFARFREVVSDPNNARIPRHPDAGVVHADDRFDEPVVTTHCGVKVLLGKSGYYAGSGLANVLIINRGVHEPQEEYAFARVLDALGPRNALPMVEVGAYWAHYSLWYARRFPDARTHMVEPHAPFLAVGQRNFALNNNAAGVFTAAGVGPGGFDLMEYGIAHHVAEWGVVHADVQGAELYLLQTAAPLFAAQAVAFAVISTHSQDLHRGVLAFFRGFDYKIVAAADVECDTFAFDGVVVAARPGAWPFDQPLDLFSRAAPPSGPRPETDLLLRTAHVKPAVDAAERLPKANWGVLGTGAAAMQFVGAVQLAHNAYWIHIGSRDAFRCYRQLSRHDPHLPAGVCASYADVVQTDAVDIVFLALPTTLKEPWAIAACRAGRHVVADKPAAATAAGARRIAAACAAAGAFFGEATAVRFRPRLLDALAAFSGAHGLRHARCVFRLPRDWIGASNIRRDASLEPGGALGDLGAHCAAALLAIDTGWRVDRSSVSVDERGAIVAATAAFFAPGDRTAALDVAFRGTRRDDLTLFGDDGASLRIEHFSNPSRMTLATSVEVATEATPNASSVAEDRAPVVAMVETASRNAALARSDPAAAEAAIAAAELLEACLEGATRTTAKGSSPAAADPPPTLQDDGFVELRGAVDPNLVALAQTSVLAALQAFPESLIFDANQFPRVKANVCRPCGATPREPHLARVHRAATDAIQAAIAAAGGGYAIEAINVDVNGPGSTDQHPHWDGPPGPRGGPDVANHRVAFLLMPLGDVEDHAGPIEVWPRSHGPDAAVDLKDVLAANATLRDLWDGGVAPLQAATPGAARAFFAAWPSRRLASTSGDAFLMYPRLWHRGTANRAATARLMLTAKLVARAAVPPPAPSSRDACAGLFRVVHGAAPGARPALVTLLAGEAAADYATGFRALHASLVAAGVDLTRLPVVVVATPAGIAAARGLADLAGVVVIEAAGGATDALGLRCLLGRSDADYDSAAIRGATLDKLLVWALGAFLQGPALFVDADAVVLPDTFADGVEDLLGLGDTPDLLSRRKLTFAMVGDPGNTGVFLFKADRAVARDLAELLLRGDYDIDRMNPTDQDLVRTYWRGPRDGSLAWRAGGGALDATWNCRPLLHRDALPLDCRVVQWVGNPKPWTLAAWTARQGGHVGAGGYTADDYARLHGGVCVACHPMWALDLWRLSSSRHEPIAVSVVVDGRETDVTLDPGSDLHEQARAWADARGAVGPPERELVRGAARAVGARLRANVAARAAARARNQTVELMVDGVVVPVTYTLAESLYVQAENVVLGHPHLSYDRAASAVKAERGTLGVVDALAQEMRSAAVWELVHTSEA